MDATTIVYAIGIVGLLFGIPPALRLRGKDTTLNYDHLVGIPGVAALMYLFMVFGIGVVTFQGHEVPIPRYVDWAITTPLLVGYAAYFAGMGKRSILGIVIVDVLMIALGVVALILPPPSQWVAFGAAAFCYLGLLLALYGPIRRSALDQLTARSRLSRLLLNYVGLVWLPYPVVWLFGPGLQMISTTGVAIMVVYMDVLSKVPFVYFVHRAHQAVEAEASSGEVVPASGEAPATSTA